MYEYDVHIPILAPHHSLHHASAFPNRTLQRRYTILLALMELFFELVVEWSGVRISCWSRFTYNISSNFRVDPIAFGLAVLHD